MEWRRNHLALTVDGGSIECVTECSYLGSMMVANSRIDVEVDKLIVNSFKAFCA